MKHKKFNELLPYTYYLKNKITKEKYYGVRYGNIKNKILPENDLGIEYFTSSKHINFNKKNINDWEVKLHYTFDTIKEAQEYENKFLSKVFRKKDWINKTNNKCIINSNEVNKANGKKLNKIRKEKYWNNGLKEHTTETKLKMSRAKKGKISKLKGKKLEEIVGKERANKIKINMSLSKKGKKPVILKYFGNLIDSNNKLIITGTLGEISEKTNIPYRTLLNSLQNKRRMYMRVKNIIKPEHNYKGCLVEEVCHSS